MKQLDIYRLIEVRNSLKLIEYLKHLTMNNTTTIKEFNEILKELTLSIMIYDISNKERMLQIDNSETFESIAHKSKVKDIINEDLVSKIEDLTLEAKDISYIAEKLNEYLLDIKGR